MELSANIINGFPQFNNFEQSYILDVKSENIQYINLAFL